MLNVLHQRPTAALGRLNDTLLLGLPQPCFQDKVDRRGHTGDNDGKGTESPPPADIQQELLGCLGSRKSGDHVGGRGEGKRNATVPEVGDVGCEHAQDVVHAGKTDGIENLLYRIPLARCSKKWQESWSTYVCGAVRLEILGRSHHDKPQS
jgi:hypothetical protein